MHNIIAGLSYCCKEEHDGDDGTVGWHSGALCVHLSSHHRSSSARHHHHRSCSSAGSGTSPDHVLSHVLKDGGCEGFSVGADCIADGDKCLQCFSYQSINSKSQHPNGSAMIFLSSQTDAAADGSGGEEDPVEDGAEFRGPVATAAEVVGLVHLFPYATITTTTAPLPR